MNSTITFINEKFVEFEKEIKKTEKRRDIKLENSYLTKRREEMDALLVRLEQYYRRRLQWIIYKSNKRTYEPKDKTWRH